MINWINLNFIKRKCELSKKGLTNPAVDLLYIDLQKRWDSMNPDLSNISKLKKSCGRDFTCEWNQSSKLKYKLIFG